MYMYTHAVHMCDLPKEHACNGKWRSEGLLLTAGTRVHTLRMFCWSTIFFLTPKASPASNDIVTVLLQAADVRVSVADGLCLDQQY